MPDNRRTGNRPDTILHEMLDAADRALEDTHRHIVRLSEALPTAKGARVRRDWIRRLQAARLHLVQIRGLFPADCTITIDDHQGLRKDSPINR